METFRLLRTALAAFVFIAFIAAPMPSPAQVTVGIGIGLAPPAIPVYAQPPCPTPNYIWTPGYWAWGPGGYYWVPGTWVAAPAFGWLWTPGYWGWNSNAYYWHRGYWGRTVGFYGGINYGFGYFGTGYVGGRWYGNAFRYNTAVTNVNRIVIHNTYVDKTVVYRNNDNHTSYNGGHGGIHAQPAAGEITAAQHQHPPTTEQQTHEQTASQDRNHLATVNHGTPVTPAVAHPYSAQNMPPHYTPVTNADRQAAQSHVVAPHQAPPPKSQKPPQ